MAKRELTPIEQEEARRLGEAWSSFKQNNPHATQTWLAAESGLGTQGAVGQYLRGVIPLNLDALIRICGVLGVDPRAVSPRLSGPLTSFVRSATRLGRIQRILETNNWKVVFLSEFDRRAFSPETHYGDDEKHLIQAARKLFHDLSHTLKPEFVVSLNGKVRYIKVGGEAGRKIDFDREIQDKLGDVDYTALVGGMQGMVRTLVERGFLTTVPLTTNDFEEILPRTPKELKVPVLCELVRTEDGSLEQRYFEPDEVTSYITHHGIDRTAYVALVRGDSLRPRYKSGECLVIETSVPPTPGDDVLVNFRMTTPKDQSRIEILEVIRFDQDEIEFATVNDGERLTYPTKGIVRLDRIASHYPRSARKTK
jgi:hypothetical protein